MARTKQWFDSYGNPALLTEVASTEEDLGAVDLLPTNHTLTRTLFWWDVRFLVPEDHIAVPRTPVPLSLELRMVNGDGSFPTPPADASPVLRSLVWATATDSVGTVDPAAEIQYRTWAGHSGAVPLESDSQRNGHLYAFEGQLRLFLIPNEFNASDIGFWQDVQYTIFWKGAFLHLVEDE